MKPNLLPSIICTIFILVFFPFNQLTAAQNKGIDPALYYLLLPPKKPVPDVVGLSIVEAENSITGAGFVVGNVIEQNSAAVPIDDVTSQSPQANARAVEGSAVNLTVSSGLPNDPITMAAPLDPTVPTTLFDSTQYLYTGEDPIQVGVVPGTFEAKQTSIIRGKVIINDGSPLSGVDIRIQGHDEFGWTLSREDGMFDLAVIGGGLLTVEFVKEGYLTSQRSIDIGWGEFFQLTEVALISLDSQTTSVDLSAMDPVQIARGNLVTDDSGERQATLFFFQGTTAQMQLPDGSYQPLDTLTVRATEYTVGPNGPAAMPAELPPTSGYTYAVELSVDEALSAGAKTVSFNQPVSFYLENFIGMPVGTKVPAAFYDSEKAAWVPMTDGKVIKVVGITNNLADVDSTGDGLVDTALALTNAELLQLAAVYGINAQLWRVSLNHFSPIDLNYGVGVPNGARKPKVNAPQNGRGANQNDPNKMRGLGSVDIENQMFAESYNISGTPYTLNYQSDSTTGYTFGNTIQIQITDDNIPADLLRVELAVYVAGRTIHQEYETPTPNQIVEFTWDGKDAYEREVVGEQPAWVVINYIYPAFYLIPAEEDNSFGLPSGTLISSGIPARDLTSKLFQSYKVMLGRRPGRDMAGWGFGVHHAYDPTEQILYTGTGGRRSVASTNTSSLYRIAGAVNISGATGDNGPAKEALLDSPGGVAVASDGTIYLADTQNHRVRKISPKGIITTVAGTGDQGFSGDGSIALAASLSFPADVDLGPDGSIYIADTGNNRIRKVTQNGIIETIAGDGTYGFSGDNGPAIAASFRIPLAVAVASDGTIFISDNDNHRLRRVGPGGLITTYAGNGDYPLYADPFAEGPATQTCLGSPRDVTVGSDGSVYVTDSYHQAVRRIDPTGIITNFAGAYNNGGYAWNTLQSPENDFHINGQSVFQSMLSQATSALSPASVVAATTGTTDPNNGITAIDAFFDDIRRIAVRNDGTLLIATWDRVYNVTSSGILSRVAGGGEDYDFIDGMPGNLFGGLSNEGVALGPNGCIILATDNMLLEISGGFPEYDSQDKLIPASDGKLIYRFDSTGRHLSSLHALTSQPLLILGYDTAGRLTSLTDAQSNVTTITRDGNGEPTRIIGPFGQTTTINLDSSGYLGTLTNPAGETTTFVNSEKGLLTSVTSPENNTYSFDYDPTGLVTTIHDPLDNMDTLSRTTLPNGHEVSLTTAEARVSTYRVENAPTGAITRTVVTPDGLAGETITYTDGTKRVTFPDGSTIGITLGPDPRFAMVAPIITNYTHTSAGNFESIETLERAVQMTDSADIFSVESITDIRTVNGQTLTSNYNAGELSTTSISPEGRQFISQVDNQGRLTEAQRSGLATARYNYDARGRLSSIALDSVTQTRTTGYTYDAEGYLDSITDPLNRVMSFLYDQNGRLVTRILPDTREVHYTYDNNGNVVSVTPPGRPAHNFSFNERDDMAEYTPPDTGTGQQQTQYSFNDDGQQTLVTRPDGSTIAFTYDSSGRLLTTTVAEGDVTYSYDPTTGMLIGISNPDGISQVLEYSGGLPTATTWSGPVAGKVTRTYDDNFRITQVDVQGAPYNVLLNYDLDNLLTSVGYDLIDGMLNLTRDPSHGLITATQFGQAPFTIEDTSSYNGFGELVNYSADCNGSGCYALQYTRDVAGRILEKVEAIDGTTSTYRYSYDLTGRLTQVKDENDVLLSAYTYDTNGNRLNGPGLVTDAVYDARDRLFTYGSYTYTYTENGELQTKTDGVNTTTLSYDAFGNLRTVEQPDGTVIGYLVDGQNRRIGKTRNAILEQGFVYANSSRPVAELDASNNIVSLFFYGSRSNVPDMIYKNGVPYRIITDLLGSPRLVVNALNGVDIIQHMDYDEFGKVVLDTNPGFQPFGFAGGLYDPETGLTRFGFRDYDAETGRWTSKDPILFSGGDTNLYGYVLNDPVNLSDSLGLKGKELDPAAVVGGAQAISGGGGGTPKIPKINKMGDGGGGSNGGGGGSKDPLTEMVRKIKEMIDDFIDNDDDGPGSTPALWPMLWDILYKNKQYFTPALEKALEGFLKNGSVALKKAEQAYMDMPPEAALVLATVGAAAIAEPTLFGEVGFGAVAAYYGAPIAAEAIPALVLAVP